MLFFILSLEKRELDCPVTGGLVEFLFVVLLRRAVESLAVELEVIPSP